MKKQCGFTLVEVLLAASILTVLVVSVSSLFILSGKVNAAAGDQTECVALAQDRMEALERIPYGTLVNGGSIDTPASGYSQYVDVNADGRNDFVVAWAVAGADTNLAQLDVRCSSLRVREGGTGSVKKVTLSTYRAKGGE